MRLAPAQSAPARPAGSPQEPPLRLLRTAARGNGVDGVSFVNPASGAPVTNDWFNPRYWLARDAVIARHAGRGAVIAFENGGRQYVLRHYLRGGLAAAFSADRFPWLGENRVRPLAELKLTLELHAEGLPVPRPVAVRYQRKGGSYTADIITDYLPDTRTLAECLAAESVPPATWAAIGRTVRRFHQRGLDHADLNAHNILLRGPEQVFLIDFDRARIRRRRGFWHDANLVRLRRSLDALEDGRRHGRFDDAQWHCLLTAWLTADAET